MARRRRISLRGKPSEFWLLVGIAVAVLIAIIDKTVLPAVFGTSLSAILWARLKKLGSAAGGIFGGLVGWVYEHVTAFTALVVNPAMQGDLAALIALAGTGSLFLVVVYNILTSGKAIR